MTECALCSKPVDPTSRSTFTRIQGWERRAQNDTRRSGSDIVLRERRGEFAHAHCIDRAKLGLSPTQEALAL